MTIKIFRVISTIIAIIIMLVIFYFSSQNATASSGTSTGFIKTIVELVWEDYDELTQEQQQEIVDDFQFIARKTAHFSIFLALGIFVLFSVITYENIHILKRILFSVLFCLVYAISDEVHQLFVEGRSCEIRDLLIDFSGSLLGIAIAYLIFIFMRRSLYAKKETN